MLPGEEDGTLARSAHQEVCYRTSLVTAAATQDCLESPYNIKLEWHHLLLVMREDEFVLAKGF